MEEIITWLFGHYGQPIYFCINNDLIHMSFSIRIEEVEILNDSVAVHHGDDSIRIDPTGATVYENEGLYIAYPMAEIAFLTGEDF